MSTTDSYTATPFHEGCEACDSNAAAAIANAQAEGVESLKRWYGGEVPNFPELSTVAHGVTVTRDEATQTWPTAEQFDAAAELGSQQALTEIQNGNAGPRETPLSGEWADEASPSRIAAAVGYTGTSDGAVDELCDAWERSYFDTWRREQTAILCAGHTEDGEPCPFFIEVNDDHEDDPDNIAPWIHLTRGDDADDALEDHEAIPGRVAALSWWEANGPERVRARFTEEA